jgi:hypothetical protein
MGPPRHCPVVATDTYGLGVRSPCRAATHDAHHVVCRIHSSHMHNCPGAAGSVVRPFIGNQACTGPMCTHSIPEALKCTGRTIRTLPHLPGTHTEPMRYNPPIQCKDTRGDTKTPANQHAIAQEEPGCICIGMQHAAGTAQQQTLLHARDCLPTITNPGMARSTLQLGHTRHNSHTI